MVTTRLPPLISPYRRHKGTHVAFSPQAATDTPCAAFYRELVSVCPDAKVIITLRDSPRQWYDSQMATVMSFFEYVVRPGRNTSFSARFLGVSSPGPTSAVAHLYQLLFKHYMYKDLPERGMQFYEEYREEVVRLVPAESLLVMNVKEGWEPPCRSLGKDVPGYPFPRVNETKDFHVNVGELVRLAGQVVKERTWKVAAVGVAVFGIVGVGILSG